MSQQDDPGTLQPIDYASPMPPSRVSIGWTITWVLGGLAMLLLLASIMLPSTNRRYGGASNRLRCSSNLRQIGQAILLYSNDNKGAYPDNFGILLRDEVITSSVFVCPSSNDLPATGATTRAEIANLSVAGHCSYIYLGKGLNAATVTPTTVVACEPLTNHGGDGMNVLYGDGHVDFEAAPTAKIILQQVKAGVWPVTYPLFPTGQSTTAPTVAPK